MDHCQICGCRGDVRKVGWDAPHCKPVRLCAECREDDRRLGRKFGPWPDQKKAG